MTDMHEEIKRRKQSISITVRGDLIAEAKELNINISQGAENGIHEAIKKAREQQWLRENRSAIDAHNARIAEQGTSLTPKWERD